MAVIGPDGEKTAMTLFKNHFTLPSKEGDAPLQYIIQVRAGASTPTSRQSRVGEADKRYTMQVIDDQAVLEAHQYPHIPELLERKYEKMMKGLIGQQPGQRQRSQRSK